MRFLILTTSHGLQDRDQLMTNELVGALQDKGHSADVFLLDWAMRAPGKSRVERGSNGEDVLVVSPIISKLLPTTLQRALKWWATPRQGGEAFARLFGDRRYDAIIAGTPALLFKPVLDRLVRKDGPSAILFIHDFFPIHHAEIGLVPQRAKNWLMRLEEAAMSKFKIIYCNLPTNIDYFKRHYTLASNPLISWTPLWTRTTRLNPPPREQMRARYSLPLDRPIAVFGGQIIEGRGIEHMLAAAALAQEQGSDVMFLFVGKGRLTPLVESAAAREGGNIRWISEVPRSDYLNLVSACDVGMAVTVPGVSSHSFPTKTMDYLRAGIPSVVAVEPDSSLAAMITEAGVALSVPFDDVGGFERAVHRATHDAEFRKPVPAAARQFLEEVLDVAHVPGLIERDLQRVSGNKGKEHAL